MPLLPLWTSSAVWQPMQARAGWRTALLAPWHDAQLAPAWPPTSGKPVVAWSKVAERQLALLWHEAQFVPLLPRWASSRA